MSPPYKILQKIKEYCEQTDCKKCEYAEIYNNKNIACTLLDSPPCYWQIKGENNESNTSKKEGQKKQKTNPI